MTVIPMTTDTIDAVSFFASVIGQADSYEFGKESKGPYSISWQQGNLIPCEDTHKEILREYRIVIIEIRADGAINSVVIVDEMHNKTAFYTLIGYCEVNEIEYFTEPSEVEEAEFEVAEMRRNKRKPS